MDDDEELPGQRLRQARSAAQEGRYADAVDEYVWLFDHALEHSRAFSGVRLSYVLNEWMQLSEKVPDAVSRMRERRDAAAARCLTATGSFGDVHDLVSLNEYLEDQRNTDVVFTTILATNPELARRCLHVALPALLDAANITVLRQLTEECRDLVRRAAQRLNTLPPVLRENEDAIDSLTGSVAKYAQELTQVLTLVGASEDDDTLRTFVLSSIEPEDLRRRVAEKLTARGDGAA